ncbi:reverse transcriptase domain-containing protein [Tanacetum coccineum]
MFSWEENDAMSLNVIVNCDNVVLNKAWAYVTIVCYVLLAIVVDRGTLSVPLFVVLERDRLKALVDSLSPGYVADSDPNEDPEEDPKEDHADYPGDEGDGDDEPSDDDDDDDDNDDEDEDPIEDEDDDEEEEHLAPVDSSAIRCRSDPRTPIMYAIGRREGERILALPISTTISTITWTTPTSRNDRVGVRGSDCLLLDLLEVIEQTIGIFRHYDADINRQRARVGYGQGGEKTESTSLFHHYKNSCQRHWDRFRHFRPEIRLMQLIPRALVVLPRTICPEKNLCCCKGCCCHCCGCCPMTAAAVEQLIAERVSTTLANHETLRNNTNGHGDRSHKSGTGIRGTTRTSCCYIDVAYAMDWKTLKKMMTDKYCPRGEIKKLEIKLWNLKVKGNDVASYTLRFQELALMCGRMFHEESEEVEKYVGGHPNMIRGNVMSYQPKIMEKAIEFANDQMDQKPPHYY